MPRTVKQNRGEKKDKEEVTRSSRIAGEGATFLKFALDKPKMDNNILKRLDMLQYGPRRNQKSCLKMIGNSFVQKSVQQLTATYAGKFTRGCIQALTWHQKYPYALASSAYRFGIGTIQFLSGIPNDLELRHGCPLKFETKAEIGTEGNRIVTVMKFHERDLNLLYGAGVGVGSGGVARMDLEHGSTAQFHNTVDDNNECFHYHSLDLDFTRNMALAGCNQGIVHHFSIDEKLVGTWRLHQSQSYVYHLEFSKKDPNLLVSAASTPFGVEGGVKIWDIRNLKQSSTGRLSDFKPLHSLDQNSGVKCAKFSPIDGSRLLTTDKRDEIRVYEGPLWKDHIVIKHQQFQHFATADWHPVNEYIVVGRYSRPDDEKKRLADAIEFYDSYSGELVETIHPPQDAMCRLNVFNPTGEYLASGTNGLILWRPRLSLVRCPHLASYPNDAS